MASFETIWLKPFVVYRKFSFSFSTIQWLGHRTKIYETKYIHNYILGIKLPGKNGSSRNSEASSAASSINGGKRKARAAATQVAKKMKKGWEVLESDSEDSDKVRIGI